MPSSTCRFIKHVVEFQPAKLSTKIPYNIRGIYVLLKQHKNGEKCSVVYVGMAGQGKDSGMWGRLGSHRRDKRLKSEWTHFTLFEVHDNITADEITELEGLVLHMYRMDPTVNKCNRRHRHRPFEESGVAVSESAFRKGDWRRGLLG